MDKTIKEAEALRMLAEAIGRNNAYYIAMRSALAERDVLTASNLKLRERLIKLQGTENCVCRVDPAIDGEIVSWCLEHALIRDERDALAAQLERMRNELLEAVEREGKRVAEDCNALVLRAEAERDALAAQVELIGKWLLRFEKGEATTDDLWAILKKTKSDPPKEERPR